MDFSGHVPVLLQPMIATLAPQTSGIYLDGTFGGGGYTRAILESTICIVHALDRDPDAIERSQILKKDFPDRFFFHEGTFSNINSLFQKDYFDGIVFDFGVSSFQFDTPDRGFSFRFDGPLDMRMTPTEGLSAADVVNTFSEEDLASIFYLYGDEQKSRHIARSIVATRTEIPFTRTIQLADCIRKIVYRKDGIDPATRTFQALRIFVNNELIEIDAAMRASINVLKNNGKIVTVTFHSLEDRLCKQFFKNESAWLLSQKCRFESITRKPIVPTLAEVQDNPRCRSAKLRAGHVVKEPVC
ncbi:MAG: 16S rRNA (cytosine(1402)-N(4))-methyltransferase RsmH [Candidatus Paracaedibacteraceae bacterium]|nr:16S rRNA (cytosine(1402)-N(4))-methyltransferase RsmH [Candidatus Paracaedibacteraceae bacterium]